MILLNQKKSAVQICKRKKTRNKKNLWRNIQIHSYDPEANTIFIRLNIASIAVQRIVMTALHEFTMKNSGVGRG